MKGMANIDTTKMIAAAHSLGAQTEIAFDNRYQAKPFLKIISFHTTLEDKSLVIAKKYWPELNYIFENKTSVSTTPVTFFAPLTLDWKSYKDSVTGKEIITSFDTSYPQYTVFKMNTTTPYTFATVKHTVKHDGFITLGNLRFPYIQKYRLEDSQNIIKQQHYYEQIILFAHEVALASLTNPKKSIRPLINKYFTIDYNSSLQSQ